MTFGHPHGPRHPFPSDRFRSVRRTAHLWNWPQGRAGIAARNTGAFPIYDDGRPDTQIRGSPANVRSTRPRHGKAKLLYPRVSGRSRRLIPEPSIRCVPRFRFGWPPSARGSDTSRHPAHDI